MDNALTRALLSFGQGASNAVASNVSAPVDGIAWLLRKAGVPVPAAPVGGSDWMAEKGLTATPKNKIAGLLGETAGMVAPGLLAAKAPQAARGLLALDDQAMNAGRNAIEGYMDSAGLRARAVPNGMESMGLEPGWFRGGAKIVDGRRSGPWYTRDAEEAASYAHSYAGRNGKPSDLREYAIPKTGYLQADRGYPSRLAHDVANLIDSDYGGEVGRKLAKELRTYGPDEGLTGGQLWQALESRFGNDGAAEILSKLQPNGRPAFNGVKGVTSPNEAYVFRHAPVRDAQKAKFNLSDYGKDDIYGRASTEMMGILGGTSLLGSYLLNRDR